MERYLHYEKAGDQYLSQVVSGLNCSQYLFAALPSHFDFEEANNKTAAANDGVVLIKPLVRTFLCPVL